MNTTKILHRLCCLILLFYFTTQSLYADWQRPVIHYTPIDYTAGTQNWQITESANSWIYAANNYGLLEFDGAEWNLYGVWNSTTTRAILVDGERIYAGVTNDFGVFRPNEIGRMDYQSLAHYLPNEHKKFGEIWSITKIDNTLYFQARHHIFRLTPDGNITTVYSSARIYCCTAHDGALYAATSEGLSVLSGTKLITLHGSDILCSGEIRSLTMIDKDRLLIGTDFQGLYVLENNQIRRFPTDADNFLRTNQLYTLAYRNDQIAIGTVLDGIVLMNTQGTNCQYVSRKQGLQNNTILSLTFDHNGNLWAGLDQGIDCIVLSSPMTFLSDGATSYGSGYTAAVYHNDLYLGTNQGLYRVSNFKADDPSALKGDIHLVEGSLGQVWNLAVVNNQLLCCHNRGLFSVEKDHLRPICTEEGFWKIRPYDSDTYIAGTYGGFYKIDSHNQAHRLVGINETAMLYETDATGAIWLCTNHGLIQATLNETKDSLLTIIHFENEYLPDNHVAIARVRDSVFISSRDFIYKIDENGTPKHCDNWNTLQGCHRYNFIHEDSDNRIWYQIDDALYVREEDGSTQTIANHKLSIPGFSNLLCLGNGYAILGSIYGFHLINLHHEHELRTYDNRSELYIRTIRTLTPTDSIVYGERHSQRGLKITLPSNDYSLEVNLASSIAEQDTRYAMYLEPIEHGYNAYSTSPQRTFHQLKYGSYTLHARAIINDSVREERTLQIRIRAPWYRSIVAKIGYTLIILLLIIYFIFYVSRRIRESKERLEQEKQEELRISRMKILELENEKTHIELQAKSQELSNLLLNEVNKNELAEAILADIRRVVDDLTQKKNAEALQRLRQLQDKLARSSDSDIDWKRFEDNFDIVNTSFLKKLTAAHPWMTQNEKKLCVYIKMGLLTKEMAPLMGLTTRGVEMIRYRLRQKLGFSEQISLKEYLLRLNEQE